MENYKLVEDEVILFESNILKGDYKLSGTLHLTLTSKKIIIEQIIEKGFIKKEIEKNLIENILLEKIKIHNGKIQAEQKSNNVFIQTKDKNINISFLGMMDAIKFTTKLKDVITNTTVTERSVDKIKGAINTVDDVLGFDTRNVVKGVLENGLTNTIFKGAGKKDKHKKGE